jgi:ankyrin repeat protein
MATDFSLHNAARNGDLVAVTAAIGEKANLDARDQHQRTPLMLAAWAGHKNIVKALIAAGAQVTLGASDNMNALHFAAQKGHTECARLLITAGIKVNSKNSRSGANALIFATQHGHKDLVALLLKRDANPLATTKAGKTARDMCKEENVEIKEMLEAAEAELAEAKAAEIQKRKERNAERFAPIRTSNMVPNGGDNDTVDAAIGPDLGPLAAAEARNKQEEEAVAVGSRGDGGSDGGGEKQKREESEEQRPAPVAKKPRVEMNYDEEDFDAS